MLQIRNGKKQSEMKKRFRLLHELFKVWRKCIATPLGSKIVKPAGIVFEEFASDSAWDIIAVLQISCSPFGSVRVRVVGRIDEQILAYFFHYATEKRFISLTSEEDPAGF